MSARSLLIHRLPCICCVIRGMSQPNRTEEHHCNLDGHAGQRRRGDDCSVSLCRWHHRGILPIGMDRYKAQTIYGPSLTDGSKLFHQVFPDDDTLLAMTNARLANLSMEGA